MASWGQASFAPQWCALSRDGETLRPSLQNLGAITGVSYSRWHPPRPALLPREPSPEAGGRGVTPPGPISRAWHPAFSWIPGSAY